MLNGNMPAPPPPANVDSQERMVVLLYLDGLRALRSALEVNTVLRRLDLSGCPAPRAELVAIERACRRSGGPELAFS